MSDPVSDTQAMIAEMDPALDEIAYCFIKVTPDIAPQVLGGALGTFREDEGVTAIVPVVLAQQLEIETAVFARIILKVHSDLTGVGLTAAVSTALADEDIACNVVAAFNHDHLFVPFDRAQDSLATLQDLQARHRPD